MKQEKIDWLLQFVPEEHKKVALLQIRGIEQLTRDDELKKLFDLMSAQDQQDCLLVLNAVLEHRRINRSKIMEVTGLSYQICGKHIDALEAKGFIAHNTGGRGQAKIYGFTNQGVRFIKMYGGGQDV